MITNVYHVMKLIQETKVLIAPDILLNAWPGLRYRLELCRAKNGAHVEMCLNINSLSCCNRCSTMYFVQLVD